MEQENNHQTMKCDRCHRKVYEVWERKCESGKGALYFCEKCDEIVWTKECYEHGEDKTIDLINKHYASV